MSFLPFLPRALARPFLRRALLRYGSSATAAGRARSGDDIEVWGQFVTSESGEMYSMGGEGRTFGGGARIRGKLHRMGSCTRSPPQPPSSSSSGRSARRFVDVYALELVQPDQESGHCRQLLSGRLLRVQGAGVKVRRRSTDIPDAGTEHDVCSRRARGSSENRTSCVDALLRHRVHIGCHRAHTHPKAFPFLFGRRNGIDIIDLEYSAKCLRRALAFLRVLHHSGGRVVFLATERPYAELAPLFLEQCGHEVLTRPWPRGQLTNPMGSGHGPTAALQRRDVLEPGTPPDLIISFSPQNDSMNLGEAASMDIITMAICDSSADPSMVTFPIPGNGTNAASAFFFCSLFADAVK